MKKDKNQKTTDEKQSEVTEKPNEKSTAADSKSDVVPEPEKTEEGQEQIVDADLSHVNLPDNNPELAIFMEKTAGEINAIKAQMGKIKLKLKPKPRLNDESVVKGKKLDVLSSVKRKALKLELDVLKNKLLAKQNLLELAKEEYSSRFAKEREQLLARRERGKGQSLYYTKRYMSRISNKVFFTIDKLSKTHTPDLIFVKRSANKKDPSKIYVALSNLLREHNPTALTLVTGSESVKAPIYNAINEALIKWDGKKPLTLAIDIKKLKRAVRGR